MGIDQDVKWYAGNKIQEFLKEKAIKDGVPEKEIADRIKWILNISKRFGAIRNNTHPPSIEELVVIADVLGRSLDDLIITKSR